MDNKRALKKALSKGGSIAHKGFLLQKKYKEKGAQDTVTAQDMEVHQKLSVFLEKATGIPVLSEEGNTTMKHTCWILDPIDGTNNYLKSMPYCGVSLALKKGAGIVLGGVFDIYHKHMYLAEKGSGAWLGRKQLHVSDTTRLNRSLIVIEAGHSPKHRLVTFNYIKTHCLGYRTLGSIAMDMCHIAYGRLDVGMFTHANIWDVAAGALIVKEAGGKITDFTNKPFSVNQPKTIASNRKMHPEIMKQLRK